MRGLAAILSELERAAGPAAGDGPEAGTLADLERSHRVIEEAAAAIEGVAEQQGFRDAAYEDLFRGLGAKAADTRGIVYTPQPIVRFMVRSVDEILARELGVSLGSEGVPILDPFLGTGTFLLQVMRQIPDAALPRKYARELSGNEIMRSPCAVAALSIERAYAERTGEHRPFRGLRLADTFELSAPEPRPAISVILGNPPYNAGQEDDNDRNRNRRYPALDRRISDTYARGSAAMLLNALRDPYVRALRWATDRLGDAGVVAFVTNGSFLDGLPFDGVRRELCQDFSSVYCLDLGGDVRKNPTLSGTTHNVFGVQVGVCISFLVRRHGHAPGARGDPAAPALHYARLDERATREAKLSFLDGTRSLADVAWQPLRPDARHTWITAGLRPDFDDLLPMGVKGRARGEGHERAIFRVFSNGPKSNNDPYVYAFSRDALERRARAMVAAYDAELDRWRREGGSGDPTDVEAFLRVDVAVLKWIRSTRRRLARGAPARFEARHLRRAAYRPFCRRWYFADPCFNEDLYRFPRIFPDPASERENRVIAVTGHSQVPFSCQALSVLPCLDVGGRPTQCFPFYVYDEDGSARRENVTDWALAEFRARYAGRDRGCPPTPGEPIGKWDVFHYVYALLHHPAYRAKYARNLARELPRVPFAPSFRAFADAGARLAEIHAAYEDQPEYPLERVADPAVAASLRVERMRPSGDGRSLRYNDAITLGGVPPEALAYRVGSRSALEWVIDQHRVRTDRRSGIGSDPNRNDDPGYVVRLVGQVIAVSLETVRIVGGLPPCEAGGPSAAEAIAAAGR